MMKRISSVRSIDALTARLALCGGFTLAALAVTACGSDKGAVQADADAGIDAGVDATVSDATRDADARVDGALPPVACVDPVPPALKTVPVAGNPFDGPVFVTQAPGETDALWVVERKGTIQLVRGGTKSVFLDISGKIGPTPGADDERGLLSVAFHPNWPTDRRFYVGYTDTGPAATRKNVVAQYSANTGDRYALADAASEVRLITQDDPDVGTGGNSGRANHNGGSVMFGPDGKLYAGLGDGGGGGDPDMHGQSLTTWQGKLLRLDVDNAAGGYTAAGNPFDVASGNKTQIWAYGLRNPWRFSFDRSTGDLYIADVGQDRWEEIDIAPVGSAGGGNYGWNTCEGFKAFPMMAGDPACVLSGHRPPVFAYAHASDSELLRQGCSITGGYVYRGTEIPALRGMYLFADYCSDDVGVIRYCDGQTKAAARVPGLVGKGTASFGEDNAGNLYMVFVRANGENVFRLAAQ